MKKLLTNKEYNKMSDELDKVKYKCKCGRRSVIHYNEEKTICSWCGRYVFKNKKDEFKYRIKEKMNRS